MSVTRSDSINLSVSAGWKSISTLRAPKARPAAIQAKPTRPKAGNTVIRTSCDVVSKASNIGPIEQLLKCDSR